MQKFKRLTKKYKSSQTQSPNVPPVSSNENSGGEDDSSPINDAPNSNSNNILDSTASIVASSSTFLDSKLQTKNSTSSSTTGTETVPTQPTSKFLTFLKGSDDSSPKDPEYKYLDKINLASNIIDRSTTSATIMTSTFLPAVENLDMFKRFAPFVSDACKIVQSVIDIYKTAEHNKSICGAILDRVYAAEAAVKYLHIRRDQKTEFFNEKNLKVVENLMKCMREMEEFCKNVSTVTGWKKYVNAKLIDQDFKELTGRFEMYMKTLHFVISVETNVQAREERKLIKQDIKTMQKVGLSFEN